MAWAEASDETPDSADEAEEPGEPRRAGAFGSARLVSLGSFPSLSRMLSRPLALLQRKSRQSYSGAIGRTSSRGGGIDVQQAALARLRGLSLTGADDEVSAAQLESHVQRGLRGVMESVERVTGSWARAEADKQRLAQRLAALLVEQAPMGMLDEVDDAVEEGTDAGATRSAWRVLRRA